ncbi:MAG TPA: hypothetical protein VFK37_03100 [Bacillales bacterium]|nr:hypothetical protein [Bacillales bacterium]
MTPNLLLVVREPVSWIRSIYIQSVKEGGHGSISQEFIENQFLLLKHSLDIDYMTKCYERYFSNVLILPYELLKSDEEAFWRKISEVFDVPFAKERLNTLNQALDLKRFVLLSKLNEL